MYNFHFDISDFFASVSDIIVNQLCSNVKLYKIELSDFPEP